MSEGLRRPAERAMIPAAAQKLTVTFSRANRGV
jgi:hypothetical protein